LGVSADDFAIFFCDLSAPQVIVLPDPVRLDDAGFSFRHVDGDECLADFMDITSNAIGSDGISLGLRCYCLLLLNMFFMWKTMWKSVIVRLVAKVASPSCPSLLCLFCTRSLSD
jgi:hypothetical protein